MQGNEVGYSHIIRKTEPSNQAVSLGSKKELTNFYGGGMRNVPSIENLQEDKIAGTKQSLKQKNYEKGLKGTTTPTKCSIYASVKAYKFKSTYSAPSLNVEGYTNSFEPNTDFEMFAMELTPIVHDIDVR